jgi:hypothetical protein
VTIAYSASGQPLWTNFVSNSGFANNYVSAAAASPDGSVYITGISSDVLPDGAQVSGGITVGYSGNGLALWTNTYGATYSESEISRAIAVGGDGVAYVTLLSSSNGNSQYATIAYGSEGIALWTNCYTGMPGSTEDPTALAVDRFDNVYVTGPNATVAYASDGMPLWTNVCNGDLSELSAIATDNWSDCFVAFSAAGALGWSEMETVRYDPTGLPLWTNFVGGEMFGTFARSIAVDASGDVYVTAEDVTTNQDADFWLCGLICG